MCVCILIFFLSVKIGILSRHDFSGVEDDEDRINKLANFQVQNH